MALKNTKNIIFVSTLTFLSFYGCEKNNPPNPPSPPNSEYCDLETFPNPTTNPTTNTSNTLNSTLSTKKSYYTILPDGVCECSDCDDCQFALINDQCYIIKLTQDVYIPDGWSCLYGDMPNKIFDCQGHKIDGGIANYSDEQEKGIWFYDVNNITIRNCVISGFWAGIVFSGYNIYIYNNVLTRNDCWSCIGIYLNAVTNSYIFNNIAYNNGTGINLVLSDYNEVLSNVVYNSIDDGIALQWSNNNIVAYNTSMTNYNQDIFIANSHYNEIISNTLKDSRINLYLIRSHNTKIKDNIGLYNLGGLVVGTPPDETHSSNALVEGNTFCNHDPYNGLGDIYGYGFEWATLNASNNTCDTASYFNDSFGDGGYCYGCRWKCDGSQNPDCFCKDGTRAKTCASEKPKYCNEDGYIVDDCVKCGCPEGKICNSENGTCYEAVCIENFPDGNTEIVPENSCSSIKPHYCSGLTSTITNGIKYGNLIDNCQQCGCPTPQSNQAYLCINNSCKLIDKECYCNSCEDCSEKLSRENPECEKVILSNDIYANSNQCIVFSKSNKGLYCNGYSIIGKNENSIALTINNLENILIFDCKIRGFGKGIEINKSKATIDAIVNNNNYGIIIKGSSNVYVGNSDFCNNNYDLYSESYIEGNPKCSKACVKNRVWKGCMDCE